MATVPPCEALIQTNLGKAPVVTDEFGCIAQLVLLDPSTYPAIEQAISDSSVQLRNGSAKYPLELPHLQKQVGGSFKRMMVQDSYGKWYAFTPPARCINQKLIISNGSFKFVDDVIPSLLTRELCPVNLVDEFDYVVGAKRVVITCEDGTTQQWLKWVLVPRTSILEDCPGGPCPPCPTCPDCPDFVECPECLPCDEEPLPEIQARFIEEERLDNVLLETEQSEEDLELEQYEEPAP